MDLAAISRSLGDLWGRIDAFAIASPEFGRAGLALAALAAVVAIILAINGLAGLFAGMRRSAIASRIRKTTDHGARILVIRGRAGRRRRMSRFLRTTMETHLRDYMFGGPFRVLPYPGPVETEAQAAILLKKTEADLVVWTEKQRRTRGVVRILSRPASPLEKRRPALTLAMPREKTAWTESLARALAYGAAKQFRPALGRPQDFRSERLQPVVEKLIAILDDKPQADPALISEMVDDVSAGALQLAFAGDQTWLDRACDIARSTLSGVNRSDAPDRWISAKITLGRALRLRAEKRFDPVMLRESIQHLSEALDALRAEPRFKLAESAAQAIGEAQKLVGARRKFSISGGGL
jgi:hypothetical protein